MIKSRFETWLILHVYKSFPVQNNPISVVSDPVNLTNRLNPSHFDVNCFQEERPFTPINLLFRISFSFDSKEKSFKLKIQCHDLHLLS